MEHSASSFTEVSIFVLECLRKHGCDGYLLELQACTRRRICGEIMGGITWRKVESGKVEIEVEEPYREVGARWYRRQRTVSTEKGPDSARTKGYSRTDNHPITYLYRLSKNHTWSISVQTKARFCSLGRSPRKDTRPKTRCRILRSIIYVLSSKSEWRVLSE